MVFDIISLLAGVAAGALAGASAGYLHSLESTADLQEKVRRLTRDVEEMRSDIAVRPSSNPREAEGNDRFLRLQQDLKEIHEEIRRMYRKTSR